jgi:hypothetical protein
VRRSLLLVSLAAVLGPAASAASALPPTEPEPAPTFAAGAPEVETVGHRLVCLHGTWAGGRVRFAYAWLRDGSPWATGRSYRPTAADGHGHVFTCIVKASGREGWGEEESWNAVQLGGTREVPI